jgi:hypothetical protein
VYLTSVAKMRLWGLAQVAPSLYACCDVLVRYKEEQGVSRCT